MPSLTNLHGVIGRPERVGNGTDQLSIEDRPSSIRYRGDRRRSPMHGNRGLIALFGLFVLGALVVFIAYDRMKERVMQAEASMVQAGQALAAANQALEAAKAAEARATAVAGEADAAASAADQAVQDAKMAMEKVSPGEKWWK
ncbi:MAG: hypothetical protein AB7M05_01050 [Alphaproteobacteria bacterium]